MPCIADCDVPAPASELFFLFFPHFYLNSLFISTAKSPKMISKLCNYSVIYQNLNYF